MLSLLLLHLSKQLSYVVVSCRCGSDSHQNCPATHATFIGTTFLELTSKTSGSEDTPWFKHSYYPRRIDLKGPETSITTPVLEPIVAPVVAPVPNTKPSFSLPYPSRRDNEKSRNQATEQIDKFYEIFKEMSFEIRNYGCSCFNAKIRLNSKNLIGK
ncbi:hypothetical protein Tco_0748844 [Tanacetum coccineum]|uniref:Uncharacterized protein n=1 Tax=Tanacetum coccineum TaxID=301880 RepID=A0ABQ4YWU1_9ASTR